VSATQSETDGNLPGTKYWCSSSEMPYREPVNVASTKDLAGLTREEMRHHISVIPNPVYSRKWRRWSHPPMAGISFPGNDDPLKIKIAYKTHKMSLGFIFAEFLLNSNVCRPVCAGILRHENTAKVEVVFSQKIRWYLKDQPNIRVIKHFYQKNGLCCLAKSNPNSIIKKMVP